MSATQAIATRAARIWAGAVLAFIAATLAADALASDKPPAPANLDFSSITAQGTPEGWKLNFSPGDTYRFEVRRDSTLSGMPCLALAETRPGPGGFSTVLQRVDARPWRGRRIWFSSELSHRGERGRAGLWVRIIGPANRDLTHDFVDGRETWSAPWRAMNAVVDVPEGAESVEFGFLLVGAGELWAQPLTIKDTGAIGEGDEPPRSLSARGLDNLVAFTRLLGYVRFFDPADSAAATDWDAFAIGTVDSVEAARTPDELASMLRRIFHPLDSCIRIGTSPIDSKACVPLKPAAAPTGVLSWSHHGWSIHADPAYLYWSRRDTLPIATASLPGPACTIAESLGGGVWCAVPTALWCDRGTSLPRSTQARWRSAARTSELFASGADRATRLADVALCWSLLEHFYPYFDVAGADWDAALREALLRAATDSGRVEFLHTLQCLVAHLNDGHARVWTSDEKDFLKPFAWRWVGDQLVITTVDGSSGTPIERGDLVLDIDGRAPAEVYEKEARPRISAATEAWCRQRSLALLIPGDRDSVTLDLEAASGGHKRVVVRPVLRPPPTGLERPAAIAQLRPGVWYLDVARLTDPQFKAMVDTLASARGMIFDVRGYPYNLGYEPLAHLTDSTLASAQWCVPLVKFPDHRNPEYEFSHETVAPLTPRFRARVVFLIDGQAISAAETWLGLADAFHLGEFVGEPTAGTNGNVNLSRLPGGYGLSFTGMKVLKQDGSRFHGVGIRPTVPVTPTIAGIREGRDEQLERALDVVSR